MRELLCLPPPRPRHGAGQRQPLAKEFEESPSPHEDGNDGSVRPYPDLPAKARAVNALPDVVPLPLAATETDDQAAGRTELLADCLPKWVLFGGVPWNEKRGSHVGNRVSERGRRGSNPQPPDRQSGTLTN